MSTLRFSNKLMNTSTYVFNWFEKKALKSFKNFDIKRDGALSTFGIFKFKEDIKYSRLILMDFNNKDLRTNSSQKVVFDVELATNLKILQLLMSLRDGASLITHENRGLRKDSLSFFHTWGQN